MPCIIIKAKKSDRRADVEALSRELSCRTGIGLERINIMVDYYSHEDYFTRDDHLIILIFISELNKKSIIEQLSQTTAALSEQYFNKKENSSAVICNLIKEGHLLVNGIKK